MRQPHWIAIAILFINSHFTLGQSRYGQPAILTQDTSKKVNVYIVESPAKKAEASSEKNSKVIVRLKSDPLLKSSRSSRSARIQNLESEHTQFKSVIGEYGKRSSNGRLSATAMIRFEYREVFNGFAIEAPKELVEQIKTLSYVSAVLEDKTVKAYDIISSEIINAPEVWSDYGMTGKGIRIGIIDTGVDYNHPDLGGGFGSGFKVKGGYDFVNNDGDPMDDNGHGTHVAGIAAANGPGLKGVAPGASLYAYKVLGRDGTGVDSWILSAIERCADPDQNPETDDALDVVNMSLGRPVDPAEPISEAVNNAIAKGIVFVVAAGNDYNFGTIGTPGIAEQAITVAATDNNDITADFSSKGPTPEHYRAKPDVSAPGVQIYSSYTGNAYKNLSGTSMASPHVAGAVALLLEKNLAWTPDIVKGVIMQSVKPSQENLFRQGVGRIDVLKAIRQEYVITPGSISLGLPEPPTKNYTVPVVIKNLCNVQKSITLTAENFHSAISVSLSKSTFSLPAHSTISVSVSISVDVSNLPYLNFPDAYFGALVADDGSTSAKIPVTLLNPAVTKLVFTGELPQSIFQIGLDGYYFNHQYPGSGEVDLFLPQGNFDLISIYGNRIVVNENVSSQSSSTITVDKSQANHFVTFKPKDERGQNIPYDASSLGSVTFTGQSRNFICFFPYAEDTLYLSNQTSYYVNMRLRDRISSNGNAFYDISITTPEGINSSKVYSNDPNDFAKVNVLNPSIPRGSNQDMFYHSQGQIFGLINSSPLSVSNPVEIYYSKTAIESAQYSFLQLMPQSGQSGYTWGAGGFKISLNDSIYFFDSQRKPIASSPLTDNRFDYNLGESLLRLNGRTYNREGKIIFHDFPAQGTFTNFYGEREKGTIYYKLKQGNLTVKTGSFVNKTFDEYIEGYNLQQDATAGPYTLSLRYDDNYVKGWAGSALAELKFDMSAGDKNPPSLLHLSLHANDVSTNHLQRGQLGKINFGISDVCLSYYGMECSDENYGLQSVEINIKRNGEEEWLNLALIERSAQWTDLKEYESYLPNDLTDGYYDLKIKAVDQQNNSLEYQLFPAFLVGPAENSISAQVVLIEPRQDAYATGVKPLFKWSSVENADKYYLQISENNSFDEFMEFSSTTEYYQLVSVLKDKQFYFWRVKASINDSATPWSTIGTFYTGNPFQSAVPLAPANQMTGLPTSIEFKWRRAVNQEPYTKFELSASPDFSYYNYFNYTTDSSLTVNANIYPNGQYYWRITTTHYFNNRYYEVTSPVFTFFTYTTQNVALITPAQGAYATGLSPTFLWGQSANASHYLFQISDNNFNTLMSEQIVYTNEFKLPYQLADNKYYYWRVGAIENQNTTWSETRNFFTSDPFQPITLLSPLNLAADQPLSMNFTWKKSFTNTNFEFQLSETDDFSTLLFDEYLSDTTLSLSQLEPSRQYFWRINHSRTFNESSFTVTSPVYSFKTTTITDAGNPLTGGNLVGYPNPFDQQVSIKFYSGKPDNVTLVIVDSFGKEIKRFTHQMEKAGFATLNWNGTNDKNEPLAAGVYFVVLRSSTLTEQIKLVLTK